MMYLAGARGIDTTFNVSLNFTGRAGNPFQEPDDNHHIYGGDATGPSDLSSGDTMEAAIIERLVAKAATQDPMIRPFLVNGQKKYVLLMHTFDAYNLRSDLSDGDWADVHKNADGKDNILYQDALGEWADVILHKHRNVIRFDDSCTHGGVSYADIDGVSRCLFLGAQAGLIAWGQGYGKSRYTWHEEKDDRGNALSVTAGSIYGVKKTRFNNKDFGVISVDVASSDPNA